MIGGCLTNAWHAAARRRASGTPAEASAQNERTLCQLKAGRTPQWGMPFAPGLQRFGSPVT